MWAITSTFIVFLACLWLPLQAQAALLYPDVLDVAVDAGESAQVQIILQNDQNSQRSYDVDFIGVELGDQVGEYGFFELGPEVIDWFDIEQDSFTLVSDEFRVLNIQIAPPVSTNDQSMVVGVRLIEHAEFSEGIDVQSGIISMIFLTLGDDIYESVEWIDYDADRTISFAHAQVFSTLRNNGDRFAQPLGKVFLESWTGRIVAQYELNPEMKRVAGGQERTFAIDIDNPFGIGPYKVTLSAQPWENGPVHSDSMVIWFFSPITTLLIILGLIALLIIWRYAKYR